ncbi:hypothetical protein [Polaribacter glomeratus]|uniref:Uncharacterized protein n=1 Tax=Polaribacter glomeratus TaxID=102 RepID=A0A2S7WIK7_9FLAO|nr:hypothetical protein [Polaribacter glomeratus]PQJ77437.1 hypothetical protein BTO16_16565 [Polaribacter glomeratus]TXD66025.1 hypothetical protein ESX12_07660 [Polaribacter glomeratus]
MKIDEALLIFYKLNDKTQDKAETAIYNNFITILLDLEQRDFTSNQNKDLEAKLLSLDLKNELYPSKKDLNKKLISFEYFLTNTFSIISKNHYVHIGMALWLFSSTILFYCFGQFSVIGALLIAIIFGIVLDAEAKGQGRVIRMAINNRLESFSLEKPLMLNQFSEVQNDQKDTRSELQNYRRKKLQQFGNKQVNSQDQNIEKHLY